MALDWQFVVVTVVALFAAGVIVRRFVPARRRSSAAAAGQPAAPAACEHCATGANAISTTPAPNGSSRTRTTPVVSVDDLRRSAKRH